MKSNGERNLEAAHHDAAGPRMGHPIMGRGCGAFAFVCAILLASVAAAPCAHATDDPADPIEGINRSVFAFNDALDSYLLEPVAKGWDFMLPDPVLRSVDNVFSNARYPIDLVNMLLQGELRESGVATGRFVLNTTLGMAGMFDIAATAGLEKHHEDFGQSLGVWGAGANPFLMLPFLGPSNPRDGAGTLADSLLTVWPYFVDTYITWGVGTVYVVNRRAMVLDEVAAAKESSLDYYSFVRNAYHQHRRAEIADSPESSEDNEEDLYYFDDLDFDDSEESLGGHDVGGGVASY